MHFELSSFRMESYKEKFKELLGEREEEEMEGIVLLQMLKIIVVCRSGNTKSRGYAQCVHGTTPLIVSGISLYYGNEA